MLHQHSYMQILTQHNDSFYVHSSMASSLSNYCHQLTWRVIPSHAGAEHTRLSVINLLFRVCNSNFLAKTEAT